MNTFESLTDHKKVHVKTQEEWNYVTKVLDIPWKTGRWDIYNENTIIYLYMVGFGSTPGGALSFEDFARLTGTDPIINQYQIY